MTLQTNVASDEMVDRLVKQTGGKATRQQIREGLIQLTKRREARSSELTALRKEEREFERKYSAPLRDILARDPRTAKLEQEFKAEVSRRRERKPLPRPAGTLAPVPFEDFWNYADPDQRHGNTFADKSGLLNLEALAVVDGDDHVTVVALGRTFVAAQDGSATFNCSFIFECETDLSSQWGSTAHLYGILRKEAVRFAPNFAPIAEQELNPFIQDATGWFEHHHGFPTGHWKPDPLTFPVQSGFVYLCLAGCEVHQDAAYNASSSIEARIPLLQPSVET
jgi:hypothetical protein